MASNQGQVVLQHYRVWGIDRSQNTGVYMLGENTIVYFAGNNLVNHNLETKEQRFLPYTDASRGDIKCVAVTQITAPGPTLLAYSLELDASIIYIVDISNWKRMRSITLSNSTVSFTSLAFSGNSKYLIAMCSSDSQLFYFEASNGNLIGQHKVTAGPSTGPNNSVVTCISFNPLDPNSICCSGKGIFRQLTKNDKGFQVKQGSVGNRDSIDFRSHIWINDGRIITAAADGHLYCVEGPNVMMTVPVKNTSGQPVTHLTPTPKGFIGVIGGNQLHVFEKQPDAKSFNDVNTILIDENATITALSLAPTDERIIALMSDSRLLSVPLTVASDSLQSEPMSTLLTPYHVGVISGIDVAYRKQLIATCGEDHAIRVWNYEKMQCEIAHFFTDQPLSVSFHPNGCFILAGFPEKIRYMALTVNDLVTQREFPIRNCKELKFSHGGHYFAAVNGNNVQVYNSYNFKNIANLRSPGQRVMSIAWSNDDNVLVSCDMNGSMILHTVRNGKQKTTSAAQQNFHFTNIICTDNVGARCYGITAPDNTLREIEDAATKSQLDVVAVPCQIVMGPGGKCLFVSTRNGTVRVYHFTGPSNSGSNFPSTENVSEITAHHAPVTALCTSPDFQYLFSSGEDGCVYMMRIAGIDLPSLRVDSKIVYSEDVLVSRSELVDQLKRLRAASLNVREVSEEQQNKINTLQQGYIQKLKEFKEKFQAEQAAEDASVNALRAQIDAMEDDARATIQAIEAQFRQEELQRENRFKMSIENEREQQEQLRKEIEEVTQEWDKRHSELVAENNRKRDQMVIDNDREIEELNRQTALVIEEKKKMIAEFDEWEVQQGSELAFEIGKREFEAMKQRKLELEQNAILEERRKNAEVLLEEIKQNVAASSANLNKKVAEVQQKQAVITAENHLKEQRIHELKELKHNIEEKESRIEELTKQNSNLEKHKQLLNDRIADWKKKLEPNLAKKQDFTITCDRMQQELERYVKNDEQLRLESEELRLKIDAKGKEIDTRTRQYEEVKQITRQFKLEVHQVYQTLLEDESNKDPTKRKYFTTRLASLYRKYVGDDGTTSVRKNSVTDIQVERNRERDALERNITAAARRINRGDEEHARHHTRMVDENVTLMTQISELNRANENLRKKKRMLDESSKSTYSAEELNKIIEMQKDRIAQLTEQLKQLQLRGNISRRNPTSRERLPPMDPNTL